MGKIQKWPNKIKVLISLLILMLLFLSVATASAASGLSSHNYKTRYTINVPSMNAAEAFKQLSEQTHTEFIYPYDLAEKCTTQPVVGRYTVLDALDIMLRNSGLASGLSEKGAITIFQSNSSSDSFDSLEGINNMNTKKNLLAAMVAFFSGVGGAQVGVAQGDAAKEGGGRILEEIVVTAQKRGEQKLQDVPMSISVLGGAELDSSTFQGVSEALSEVGGLSFVASPFGGDSQISVRGVSASAQAFTGSSTVGYYLNNLPFGLVRTALAPDAGAYDLSRVEVLRGPQGTLYGASSLNGVVRILTKEVNLNKYEFKARTSVSTMDGGGESYRGDLAINVPLIADKLAIRAVLGYNDLSGWVDNIDSSLDDSNDGELENYRFKVKYQPTERLSLGLGVWSSRSDYANRSVVSPDQGINTEPFLEPFSSDYDTYDFTIDYDFDNFSLISSTSYLEHENTDSAAFDGSAGEIVTVFDNEMFAQEIRLVSTHEGVWQWSAGGMYREAIEDVTQTLFSIFEFPYGSESISYAVFGEVTRALLDDSLEVTFGLRYFEDEETERANGPFPGTPEGAPLYKNVAEFDALTPRLVVTWYPEDDLTLYASYSEGFRSGFGQDAVIAADFPGTLDVEEDTLSNYEVGAKGVLLEGRLAYDVAVYYIDWDDVQQSGSLEDPDSGLFFAAPLNGESASGAGVDINITAQPTEQLRLALSFGWNDLAFDGDVFFEDDVLFSKGDRLNGSAEYTAALSLGYDFPLGISDLDGRFSASVNHVSSLDNRGPERDNFESDYITTGKIKLAIATPEEDWITTLYMDNVGNEDGAAFAYLGVAGTELHTQLRPRTVGVQVEYRY